MLQTEKQLGPIWMIQKLKNAEQRQMGGWQAPCNETLRATTAASEGADGARAGGTCNSELRADLATRFL